MKRLEKIRIDPTLFLLARGLAHLALVVVELLREGLPVLDELTPVEGFKVKGHVSNHLKIMPQAAS